MKPKLNQTGVRTSKSWMYISSPWDTRPNHLIFRDLQTIRFVLLCCPYQSHVQQWPKIMGTIFLVFSSLLTSANYTQNWDVKCITVIHRSVSSRYLPTHQNKLQLLREHFVVHLIYIMILNHNESFLRKFFSHYRCPSAYHVVMDLFLEIRYMSLFEACSLFAQAYISQGYGWRTR